MGWVIIFLLFVLVMEWITQIFGFFSVGLTMNKYMIMATIAFILGFIYLKFSSLSYKDYKLKEKIMKRFFGSDSSGSNSRGSISSGSNSGGSNLPAVREINVYDLTMQQLNEELLFVLTTPKPLIFKGWSNNRLKLDVERLKLFHEYIQDTLAIQQSLCDLRVEEAISYKKFEAFSKLKIIELEADVKKAEFNFKLLEDYYENEVTRLRTDTERMKIELQMLQNSVKIDQENHAMNMLERSYGLTDRESLIALNKMKTEAEIYCLKLKADSEYVISTKVAALFDKIIKDLQMDDITPSQVLVLISIFGKGGVPTVEDFEVKKQLLVEEINRMKQENEYKKYEAREKFIETEHKQFKLEKDRLNYNS